MKILRAADYRRMPWKNGGGETVEIAIFPEGAGLDTFHWRVSTATIAEDGDFSIFSNVDRTLSILEGDGIELASEVRDPVLLTQISAPYTFPADAPASARLMGGKVIDLNVMTRRRRFCHAVEAVAGSATLTCGSGLMLILCHRGVIDIHNAGNSGNLAPLDCAVIASGTSAVLSGEASGFVIRLAAPV